MKIEPIMTEKSLKMAKAGLYSFWVTKSARKPEIKREISSLFGIHVKRVGVINYQKSKRKNFRGVTVTQPARKKAIVTLSPGEKIELFERSKK